ELVEDALEEFSIAVVAMSGTVDLVDTPRGPGVNGGIDVTEGPFVSGELAVGVHEPLAAEKNELFFGVFRVDQGQTNAVEGKIPGCEPIEFPFIGNGHDFAALEMAPLAIAAFAALGWRRRLQFVTLDPAGDIVMIELLRPDEAREGLALDKT